MRTMSLIKSVKALSFLWLGSIGGAACAFFSQVVLARKLTSEDFGLFSSVMAMILLVVPLAGFGVAQFWLKIFGAEGWSAVRWFPSSFKVVFITTSISFGFVYSWAWLGPHGGATKELIVVLSFYILGQLVLELVSGKYQLEEKYIKLSMWQFLPHFIRLSLLVVVFIFLDLEALVLNVGYMYSVVSLGFCVIGFLILVKMYGGRFSLKGHGAKSAFFNGKDCVSPTINAVLISAWPFGVAAASQLIYYQSDIILIKYFIGDASAGIYNVSFTVMAAVYLFPGVLYQKFFLPKMHRWANHDRSRFYEVYRIGNLLMVGLGLSTAIFIWIVSNTLIKFVFGAGFEQSIILLNILAISAPITFVSFSIGATLVTQEHMKIKVKYMFLVAVLNVLLNLVFIPIYGVVGAACTTVFSNLMLLVLYYIGAQRFVFNRGYFRSKN